VGAFKSGVLLSGVLSGVLVGAPKWGAQVGVLSGVFIECRYF
jgi:hypothetical protein